MNVQAAGFGELGIALALLEHGREGGLWALSLPGDAALTAGALRNYRLLAGCHAPSDFSGAVGLDRAQPGKSGAFANDNTNVDSRR